MADEAGQEAGKAGGGSKKLIIIGVLLVVLIGGGAGAAMMLMGGDEEEVAEGEEVEETEVPVEKHYFSLDPAFVVNFADPKSRAKFLKVELDAVTLDEAKLDAVRKHMPAIRNSVVLLLSQQTYGALIEHEGKEALRLTVRDTIRQVLEESAGEAIVEDVYFSSFVMQ